jgi:hypothetical protein
MNCAPLGHYAASSGNSLPTFRDNLSVRLQVSQIQEGRDYHYLLRNDPEECSSRLFDIIWYDICC